MFSVILSLIWGLVYIRSPYLFPGIASIFYFTNLQNESLNVLVSFPLGLFYFANKLQQGQPPKHHRMLTLEFIRWGLIWIFYVLDLFSEAQGYALAGYCYVTALMIFLEFNGKDEKVQVDLKYKFYIGWTFWIILWLFFQPMNLCVALIIHGSNFIIDFRL